MTRFGKTGYTVEIYTGTNPHEDWINVMNGLIDLLMGQNTQNETFESIFYVYKLMSDLMPTEESLSQYINEISHTYNHEKENL